MKKTLTSTLTSGVTVLLRLSAAHGWGQTGPDGAAALGTAGRWAASLVSRRPQQLPLPPTPV